MDYKELQEKNLVLKKEIDILRRMNKELLEYQHQQDLLEASLTGNLGHWYWDIEANKVTFNPLKAEVLGFFKEDIPKSVGLEFFTDRIHPDDNECIMEAMREHLKGNTAVWEVNYRIQTKDGQYKTYYERAKVTQRTKEGRPLFLSGIAFDISEFEEEKRKLLVQNKEWEKRSKRDDLSGLYNRSNIFFRLGQSMIKANHTGEPMSLVMFDIDNLKHQNMLFGPLFGDEVIRKAGKMIQLHLSVDDMAGSIEGGRFLIILPKKTKEEAYQFALQLSMDFQETEFSAPAEITSSAGISQYRLGETVSQLFTRAEDKLRIVKREGKNHILF